MYSDWVWVLLVALFIWLAVLSFLVWQSQGFLRSLFPKSGERDIRAKFKELLEGVSGFEGDLDKLKERRYIQKVSLIRYNPYGDTGGDQSFTLALLDDKGTGIVLTSLHARSGTRVFAKDVLGGKSNKYQFSKEEEEVIKKAIKNE